MINWKDLVNAFIIGYQIDCEKLEVRLRQIPGVMDLHSLHVWALSGRVAAMCVHIKARNAQSVQKQAHLICTTQFGFKHVTVQAHEWSEDSKCPCGI